MWVLTGTCAKCLKGAGVQVEMKMRKRKYTEHNISEAPDVLTEDIDAYLASSVKNAIPVAEVHNLVGTCQIESNSIPLDLEHVSRLLPNSHFDKQKFAAITIRLHDPVCTVLLFTSGKLVLTGTKTFLDCIASCVRVLDILRSGTPGVFFKLTHSHIQNIVGNVNLKLSDDQFMDLDAMHKEHSVFCTYQKNMFPGLIFRPPSSPIVLLIFSSGKIVLTGAKSSHAMHRGWNAIWPHVRQYVQTRARVTVPAASHV